MTLYVVTWSDAYDPAGNWHVSNPVHAQSPMAAAEKVEPKPNSRVRVFPLMGDEWGNPQVYGYGWGSQNEEPVQVEE